MDKRRKIALAVVAFFVVAFAIGGHNDGGGGSSGGDADGDSAGARAACEQFVQRRLKSPSTAEFSDQTEAGDGAVWTASGSVDSQNSFGAMMRNEYTCKMEYLGGTDESYKLTSFGGIDN